MKPYAADKLGSRLRVMDVDGPSHLKWRMKMIESQQPEPNGVGSPGPTIRFAHIHV